MFTRKSTPDFPLKNIFGKAHSSHFLSSKMCLVFLTWPGASSNKFSFSTTKDSLAACLWTFKGLAADYNSWSLSTSKSMSHSGKSFPIGNNFSLMLPSLIKTSLCKWLTL